MRKFFSEYKKPAISAVVFFVTLVGMTSAYAAFTALTDVITGQTLSKDAWNTMVANLNDLNGRSVPQGAVMAFFGTSCPANWSPADGTTNGVKKTDGTSGTLDLRGEFIRGLDGGRGIDSSRTLGSSQSASQVMGGGGNPSPPYLSGNNWIISTDNGSTVTTVGPSNLEQVSYATFNGNYLMGWSGYSNGSTSWNIGQVRPRNVALLYCVKN